MMPFSAVRENFREIRAPAMADGVLYRSSHPISGGRQVPAIILAAARANIRAILNLSDSPAALQSKTALCPWYRKLCNNGSVLALHVPMGFAIASPSFRAKVKKALQFLSRRDPPYLIHCEAGIDRTGFFSLILEAFMEESPRGIAADYMRSFVDEDELSENDLNTGEQFVKTIIAAIHGSPPAPSENLAALTERYFLQDLELSPRCLRVLREKLSHAPPA